MDKVKSVIENYHWKLKDTFFINLVVGFVILNYKFLYVLFNQQPSLDEFPSAASIVDKANMFLNLEGVFMYAIVMTFAYPLVVGNVVVKWRQIVEHWKERWIDKSFPSNKQYQQKIEEVKKIKAENAKFISDCGNRLIKECENNYDGNNWNFVLMTSAEGCRFKEGEFAIVKEFDGVIKLTSLENYNGDKADLRYVYCKIDNHNYVACQVNQFSFQPVDFINSNAQYFVLTENGPKFSDQDEYEEQYSKKGHEIIFSFKKNKDCRWQTVRWPE